MFQHHSGGPISPDPTKNKKPVLAIKEQSAHQEALLATGWDPVGAGPGALWGILCPVDLVAQRK